MRLIRVHSNKESFHTVNFNPTGLSFIVAEQKDPDNKEKGRTYNGVGKSLLVKIIHFCLGASFRTYRSFCKELPGWEFSLDFVIGDKQYTSTRSTDNNSILLLNGEALKCANFNKRLEALCFNIPEDAQNISFRSLLPFFIRPERSSYNHYNQPIEKQTGYQSMLSNAHLLGLDINLAQQKRNFKLEIDKIKDLLRSFDKDGLLRDYSTGVKDVSLKLVFLEDRIKQLESDLSSFVIAEDYNDVQEEADYIKTTMDELSNTIVLLQSNINRIDETLEIEPTLQSDELIKSYEEVQIHFSEHLIKTLDELQNFNNQLISTRRRRLLEQRNTIEQRLLEEKVEHKRLQHELDKKMQYLGGHRALDAFVTVSNKCVELKNEREKLIRFQELQKDLSEKNRELQKQLIESEQKTELYLTQMENETSELRDFFMKLANRFYPQVVAGLSITNNEGENQLRYTIDASIESDSSDGINDVKTFCYDLTLLFKGHNHKINFIFHDSRLFSDPDERQKAEMFNIVHEFFSDSSCQYIATVNQNQLEEIKKVLGDSNYSTIITPNTILTLTDESTEAKLLGVSVSIENK